MPPSIRKPLIAIASSGYDRIRRGIETWSASLASHLVSSGEFRIVLLRGWGRRGGSHEIPLPGLYMNSWLLGGINSPLSWGYRHLIQQKLFAYLSVLYCKLNGVDLLHTSDLALALSLRKMQSEEHFDARLLFTDGNVYDLRRLTGLPYVHETHASYVEEAERLGISTADWSVIPHFVDTKKFTPFPYEERVRARRQFGISQEDFVILTVGAYDEGKRLSYVMGEVERFGRTVDDRVVLISCGQREPGYSQIMASGERLQGLNFIPILERAHREMPTIYNLADVFVLGSLTERFGLAFLEAMACGVPSIGHLRPASTDIIGPGGTVCNLSTEGSLANVLYVYLDSQSRSRTATTARAHVEDRYSASKIVPRFVDLYRKILGSGESHKVAA